MDALSDREVLTAMLDEVAGPTVASANAKEKLKAQKGGDPRLPERQQRTA